MRRSIFGKGAFAGTLATALMAALVHSGCSTTPVTGRSKLNLVDDKSVVASSIQAFEELKQQHRISRDPRKLEMMDRVCTRLTESLPFWEMPLAEWEFVVFEAPKMINALAMPGGKVAVFSGVFDVARTDDELAVIVAHEIAHVTAKHVHERLSRQMLVNAGGIGLMVGTGGGLTGMAVLSAYGYGTGTMGLGFDRQKETEADYIGLIYMARAGFNPRAAIDVWERMNDGTAGKSAPPEWLSTHPSNENRLARLYGWMTEAEAEYEKAKGSIR